jgi:hypothetical protein
MLLVNWKEKSRSSFFETKRAGLVGYCRPAFFQDDLSMQTRERIVHAKNQKDQDLTRIDRDRKNRSTNFLEKILDRIYIG